jgi:hypothetical protein
VFLVLEAYGFCGPGEAVPFVAEGSLDLGGALPTNTHGGLLGEAYIHGINSIQEGVRQVRGTAVNQVARVDHVLVSSLNSGLVLGPNPPLRKTVRMRFDGKVAFITGGGIAFARFPVLTAAGAGRDRRHRRPGGRRARGQLERDGSRHWRSSATSPTSSRCSRRSTRPSRASAASTS